MLNKYKNGIYFIMFINSIINITLKMSFNQSAQFNAFVKEWNERNIQCQATMQIPARTNEFMPTSNNQQVTGNVQQITSNTQSNSVSTIYFPNFKK